MSVRSRLVTMLGCVVLLSACGAGEIGEDCDSEADTDECVDGAFCAKTKSGDLQCMQVCVEQSTCASKTECTGAKGTTKVCQPKE
jgi:hypothetical protein